MVSRGGQLRPIKNGIFSLWLAPYMITLKFPHLHAPPSAINMKTMMRQHTQFLRTPTPPGKLFFLSYSRGPRAKLTPHLSPDTTANIFQNVPSPRV